MVIFFCYIVVTVFFVHGCIVDIAMSVIDVFVTVAFLRGFIINIYNNESA